MGYSKMEKCAMFWVARESIKQKKRQQSFWFIQSKGNHLSSKKNVCSPNLADKALYATLTLLYICTEKQQNKTHYANSKMHKKICIHIDIHVCICFHYNYAFLFITWTVVNAENTNRLTYVIRLGLESRSCSIQNLITWQIWFIVLCVTHPHKITHISIEKSSWNPK